MARHQYVILSRAVPGRLEEFEAWYDGAHLSDVCRVAGVVSAKRYRIGGQKVTGVDMPSFCSLAIYEIESDDPQQVADSISAIAGSAAMPLSDAMDKMGLIQLLAHEVAAVTAEQA